MEKERLYVKLNDLAEIVAKDMLIAIRKRMLRLTL